jgi:hypothetical protein
MLARPLHAFHQVQGRKLQGALKKKMFCNVS